MMLSQGMSRLPSPFLLFLLWASTTAVVESAPCPCVPDAIKFQFDFQLGCDHPPSGSDFTSKSSCSISGGARNSSIKKVVIQDLLNEEEVELDVEEVLEEGDSIDEAQKKYSFTYTRSKKSPTVLWLDFHQTSSATRAPIASIDLNYMSGSTDCVDPYNPVFWAGDWVYFLTVVRIFTVAPANTFIS